MALGVSLEFYGEKNNSPKAQVLADALDIATEKLLDNGKSPSRKVNEIDTRGSHFYLALYWAQALAEQNEDAELKSLFTKVSESLNTNESKIAAELINDQGTPKDIGGYYLPDSDLISKAMRPSDTFNDILASI